MLAKPVARGTGELSMCCRFAVPKENMTPNSRGVSRRHVLASGVVLLGARQLAGASIMTSGSDLRVNASVDYGGDILPKGIRSRYIDTNNQVTLHILEAGFESPGRPCLVLLHGFPELAYTWRNQMLPLAEAGYHIIAPDARGYGLSAPQPVAYTDSLVPYSMFSRVSDVLGLVRALGYVKVAMVVGHDWGGPTAQWCARSRPDVFRSVVSVSTPFLHDPRLPLDTVLHPKAAAKGVDIDQELAALPRPRKHYATYSASREANDNMWHAAQRLHMLLREQFYCKSADWEGNKPFALKSNAASEYAKMPTYYIMDLQLVGIFLKLDELKIVDFHPPKRMRKLTARNFSWRKDGAVQEYFLQRVIPEFFNARFDHPGDEFRFVGGLLSASSMLRLQASIRRFADEYEQLAHQDARLPLEERHGWSAILALRLRANAGTRAGDGALWYHDMILYGSYNGTWHRSVAAESLESAQ